MICGLIRNYQPFSPCDLAILCEQRWRALIFGSPCRATSTSSEDGEQACPAAPSSSAPPDSFHTAQQALRKPQNAIVQRSSHWGKKKKHVSVKSDTIFAPYLMKRVGR